MKTLEACPKYSCDDLKDVDVGVESRTSPKSALAAGHVLAPLVF